MESVDDIRVQIDRMGFAITSTTGSSMRPLIWGGDHMVVVAPFDGEPELGDILMFRTRGMDGKRIEIVHRLVEIRSDEQGRIYMTRGDNRKDYELMRRKAIIGRIAEVHRVSGYRPWHILPGLKFTVNDRSYRIYTRIWQAIWPLRRAYYDVRYHACSLLNRARKKGK